MVAPLVAVASACSWSAVERLPVTPPLRGYVNCTESQVDPKGDLVVAAVSGTVALICGATAGGLRALCSTGPKTDDSWACNRPGNMVGLACALPAALVAIPYALSAEYGFRHTKRCREFHLRFPGWRPPSSPASSGLASAPSSRPGVVIGPLEPADGARSTSVPDRLDPLALQQGMRPVNARVQECHEHFKVPGMVMVIVTIAPSGHVSSATVIERFAGTATGQCVANMVREATFAPFTGPPVTLTYPFVLRPPNP